MFVTYRAHELKKLPTAAEGSDDAEAAPKPKPESDDKEATPKAKPEPETDEFKDPDKNIDVR